MSKTRDTLISANEAKKRLRELQRKTAWMGPEWYAVYNKAIAIIDALAKESKKL